MSESLVWEVIHLPSCFVFDQLLSQKFSGCVVGEGEVYLLVKELFAIFHACIKGFVTAGHNCNSISFCPQFVLLHISEDFLHPWGYWIDILLFGLDS